MLSRIQYGRGSLREATENPSAVKEVALDPKMISCCSGSTYLHMFLCITVIQRIEKCHQGSTVVQ